MSDLVSMPPSMQIELFIAATNQRRENMASQIPGQPSPARSRPCPGSAASAPAPKMRRGYRADRERKSPAGVSGDEGLLAKNLKYMRKFAKVNQNETIVQEMLAQIT